MQPEFFKKARVIILLFILFSSAATAQNIPSAGTPTVFDTDSCPVFVQNLSGDFYLCKPWSFNNPANSGKQYPLFVYLHGGGSNGAPEVLPCFSNNKDKKGYPSFIYLPHASGSWDYSKIISQIESLKTEYAIDVNRIYLMGYSMGGSGSFALANAYYDSKKQLFAAIVRMAGQSQPVVRDTIAEKTSIWYHIGLSDEPVRVKIARETYNFLKGYPGNSVATETTEAVAIPGYTGTTLTLTKGGIEVVKYTEYNAPVAHGISNFPLSDPNLLKWLFNQSLIKRHDDRKKE